MYYWHFKNILNTLKYLKRITFTQQPLEVHRDLFPELIHVNFGWGWKKMSVSCKLPPRSDQVINNNDRGSSIISNRSRRSRALEDPLGVGSVGPLWGTPASPGNQWGSGSLRDSTGMKEDYTCLRWAAPAQIIGPVSAAGDTAAAACWHDGGGGGGNIMWRRKHPTEKY